MSRSLDRSVDQASMDSFPASDPPPFWARGPEPPPGGGAETTTASASSAADTAPRSGSAPSLRADDVGDLDALISWWPVHRASTGATDPHGTLAVGGDPGWRTAIASVGKLLVGMAALVAVEEEAIDLDEPAGPDGSTVRHLLAHASGLTLDEDRVIAPVGRRRIYSNVGIERVAAHLAARTGMSFDEYLRLGVLEPLGMAGTQVHGSPARDVTSRVEDLLRFARELLRPTLVSAATLEAATRPQFPELAGVLPDFGRFDPDPWGLAFEVRGDKDPHWTGRTNSPRTFGHFGGSGSFLWVDPDADVAAVALTDRDFGPWAMEAWPEFSDVLLRRYAAP